MNAKETATLREVSHQLQATCDRFNPESMTSRDLSNIKALLESLMAVAPKPRKSVRQCFLCFDTSRDATSIWTIPAGPHKYAFKPAHVDCVAREDEKVAAIFAALDRRRGRPTFDSANASTCACGHGSEAHRQDELENYLDCEASNCKCDHFHYSSDSDQTEDEAA